MDRERRQTLIAVIFAIVFPTLVTWVYFIQFEGRSAVVGGVGKAIQFAFPVCWVFFWMKKSLRNAGLPTSQAQTPRWTPRTSLLFGVGTGIIIILITIAYYNFAIGADRLSGLKIEVGSRIEKMSLDNPLGFITLGVFYSLLHSFMEEYYFRWFVFGRLRFLTSFWPAAIISALAFMAHHVIVLAVFFGNSIHTFFLSLCIAVGGLLWAYQYERSRSLIGPWLSHLFVDAGIFLVGYQMIFSVVPK